MKSNKFTYFFLILEQTLKHDYGDIGRVQAALSHRASPSSNVPRGQGRRSPKLQVQSGGRSIRCRRSQT
jgi:hypothetical protein